MVGYFEWEDTAIKGLSRRKYAEYVGKCQAHHKTMKGGQRAHLVLNCNTSRDTPARHDGGTLPDYSEQLRSFLVRPYADPRKPKQRYC